jgi:hypothetical protein
MRLLKRQTTNLRSIAGKGVQYDIDDQVIVDSQRAMVVPKGPYNEQPGFAGDGTYPAVLTAATEGQIRYNTSDNQLEAYQNGAWREIRFKEPNQDPGIVWQNLGTGDAVETVFGELQSNDTDYPVPAASENILVLIENVLQIPGTNYNIRQTAEVDATGPNTPYASSGTGWWIEFTSPVPFGKDVTVVHNFDK